MKGAITGEVRSACGSDAVYILDGRKSLMSHIWDSQERMEKLKYHNYIGFYILKGNRFDNSNIVLHKELN